ncbi:hypothetical protein N1F78_00930 [Seonamhaeicola sp. MEBiC1930]|uniref:hypothetical protein n=1 Tax=Seonamhaeicola sp. MEBiC01930 TaxID=2976768 RepID=UPI0032567F5C
MTIKLYDWFFLINQNKKYPEFFPSLLTLNGLLILNLIFITLIFTRRYSTILKTIYSGIGLVMIVSIVLSAYASKQDIKTFKDFWDAYANMHTQYVWMWLAKINYIATPILFIILGIVFIVSGRFNAVGYKVFEILTKYKIQFRIFLGAFVLYLAYKGILSGSKEGGFEFNFYVIRNGLTVLAIIAIGFFIYRKLKKKRLWDRSVSETFHLIQRIIKGGIIIGLIYISFLHFNFLWKYGVPSMFVEKNIEHAKRIYELQDSNMKPFNLFPTVLFYSFMIYLMYIGFRGKRYKGGYLNPKDPWLPQNALLKKPEFFNELYLMKYSEGNLDKMKKLCLEAIEWLVEEKKHYQYYLDLWRNFEPLSDEEYYRRGNKKGDRLTEYNRRDVNFIRQEFIQWIRYVDNEIKSIEERIKKVSEDIKNRDANSDERKYEKL